MRHLSLVPVSAPQPAVAAATTDEPAAYVPVKLLLAASGRCSCEDCCLEELQRRHQPVRRARGTDRQPVRNLHLLS